LPVAKNATPSVTSSFSVIGGIHTCGDERRRHHRAQIANCEGALIDHDDVIRIEQAVALVGRQG